MPALRLLGRRWHIASDDLPVFSSSGACFHIVFTAFLAASLAIVPGSCVGSNIQWLQAFLASLLAVDAALALTLTHLTVVGLKGPLRMHATHAFHPHASRPQDRCSMKPSTGPRQRRCCT